MTNDSHLLRNELFYFTQLLQLVQTTEMVLLLLTSRLYPWTCLIPGKPPPPFLKSTDQAALEPVGTQEVAGTGTTPKDKNRVGCPWPVENGHDVEAAAQLTLVRAKQFLTSMVLSLPLHACSSFSSSAAATCSSGFMKDMAPHGDNCKSTSQKRGSGKGHIKLLRKYLVLMLVAEGLTCNTELTLMSIGFSVVQQAVFHFSSHFAFPVITFIKTSLSFPCRNVLLHWNQMIVALLFERYLTANSKVKWNLATTCTRVGWPCSEGIKEISLAAQKRIFQVLVSFFWPAL